MCGIVGSLALALDADPDQNWVAGATERITHRGPDDEGFYTDPDVALGYKRLAIIDLSPGGHQPMRSSDGRYWMVFNGEIYNYIELGRELLAQGVRLQSSSDSEVLLEAYARVGKDVVHRLRGMYAFAIWDTWTRELFCARDPFGIKPFYYRVDRGPAIDRGPSADRGLAADQHSAAEWDQGDDGRGASGGRHAGPAVVPPRSADDAPVDWFTPVSPTARRPGRHATGGPDASWPSLSEDLTSQPEVGPAPGFSDSAEYAQDPHSALAGPAASGSQRPGAALTPPLPFARSDATQRGVVPAEVDRVLRFASERKALADPGELRDLDMAALRRYLAFQYVPAPDTITPPIRVLPPGHALVARPDGTVDTYRFWRAGFQPAPAVRESTPRAILAAMRDSVAV
ncbi:MAG TPA: hypothetical protein VIV12_00280, partial [Streptosporangiaceae bacterium]